MSLIIAQNNQINTVTLNDTIVGAINELIPLDNIILYNFYCYLNNFFKIASTNGIILNIIEFPWFKHGRFLKCEICSMDICLGHITNSTTLYKINSEKEAFLNHKFIGAFYSYLYYLDNELFRIINEPVERMLENHCNYRHPKIFVADFLYCFENLYNTKLSLILSNIEIE